MVLASLASFARGHFALAQVEAPPDDGVRLDYLAPAGCSDASVFRAELHARNRRLRSGQRVVGDVSVTLTEVGPRVAGRLVIRAGGKTGTREFEGASCGEVVAALALVAAVDLDEASPQPKPAVPEEDLPPPPPPPPPPKPPSRSRWRLALGAHASMTNGVSDGLLFGAPVFFDVERQSDGVLSPSARVLFEGTVSGQEEEAVSALRFTWFMGGIEACPIRIGPVAFEARPCVRAEVGALGASPQGVSFGHGATRPWASVGAVARVAWSPTRLIFLEIEGGGRVPVVRPEFAFLPDTTLYRVPAVSALVEAGLGVRFY